MTQIQRVRDWLAMAKPSWTLPMDREDVRALVAEIDAMVNTPEVADFIEGVRLEAAHQRERWGDAHDRNKSAENWYWLVGYLAGKALRAAITGDADKARHHTISAAAALSQWHAAISRDANGCGIGDDADLKAKAPA